MNPNLIAILRETECSLVMQQGNTIRTFHRKGVQDLYRLYTQEPAFMRGALAADKVVGKGAATLFILGGIAALHAEIISTPALRILQQAGVEVSFGMEVPYIINRKKDGRCPLETLCSSTDSPDELYAIITQFIHSISKQ